MPEPPPPGLQSCLCTSAGSLMPSHPSGLEIKGMLEGFLARNRPRDPAPRGQGGTGQWPGMGTPCTQSKAHGLQ